MPRPVLAILTALAVLVAVGVVGVAVAAVHAWQGQPSAAAGRRTPSSPGSPTPPRATSTPVPTPTRAPTPTPRPALRVVGLGDSVPAADACGCDGYLEQLVPALRATTGRQVTLANDATGGWTTQDVVNDLAGGTSHDDLAAGADLVVVEIGANDFDLSRLSDPSCAPAGDSACFRSTLSGLRSGLTEVVNRVRALAPSARVALLGYWNVGLDGSVGRSQGPVYVSSSDALTKAVNRVVGGVTEATGSIYVDAYTPLKGADGQRDATEDLVNDGDHPSASGHKRLADAILDALQTSGSVASWAERGPTSTQ